MNLLTDTLASDDLLLHSKALEPLSEPALKDLEEIAAFKKLDTYSEQDVREAIIAPILRAMGYRKESMFSLEHEKTLTIAGKQIRVDYSATLFEEDFWIIEAKKPNVTKGKFGYETLWQALQYAIHPEINAALIVLCDGHALEIFDREQSLEAPVLRVEREHLVRDFDRIRIFLSPLQAWFFQKRRVVRLIDKVLDCEFNTGRLDEFGKLLDRRIRDKQRKTVDNMRARVRNDDIQSNLDEIAAAEPGDLIEALFPLELSWKMMEALNGRLLEHSAAKAFPILHRILGDGPCAANHSYHIHALHYLISLEASGAHADWLPAWLAPSGQPNLPTAITKLIALNLSCFDADPARKVVLLHAAATRRLAKAMVTLAPALAASATIRHQIQRVAGDEFSMEQVLSSPKRHQIFEMDRIGDLVSRRFVADKTDPKGKFQLASAKLELQACWRREVQLLNSAGDYWKLRQERDLGEIYPTEWSAVVSDQLGHGTLCTLEHFPGWKTHALSTHRPQVEALASLGSWQARDWLGLKRDAAYPGLTEQQIADRFFFGDTDQFRELYQGYGGFGR